MKKKETADTDENDILKEFGKEVVDLLLIDHTKTDKLRKEAAQRMQKEGKSDAEIDAELKKIRSNITWATSDYEKLGEGFRYGDEILIENITGKNHMVVRPRCVKSKEEQNARIKDKAEVFTPSWVCNCQNNLVDEAWFGRKEVFNRETIDENGKHTWKLTERPIQFEEGKKSWRAYVRETRMEITCGEAPYLVSRYDTTTGELIPLERRIGLLDRKLQVISEHVDNSKEWLDMAQAAYMNIYGYEWQGDSLLLAREALLYTLKDYYEAKFGKKLNQRSVKYIAYIISWNLWQMDGLKMVVPDSCDAVYEEDLFGGTKKRVCNACVKGKLHGHIGVKCIVRDWKKQTQPKDWKGSERERDNKAWQKIRFSQVVGGKKDGDEEDED